MSKIWFMGEALIDFVPTPSPAGDAFAPREGGSPFNAAKAACQAGADVGFLGSVSTDMFGDILLRDLQAHHVDVSRTPRTDDPSTLAFVALDEAGLAQYAFYNRRSATALMNPDPAAFKANAGDMFAFGSISLIDNPGADAITAFALAQDDATLIALDPNARPSMIHDLDEWRTRIAALTAKAGLVRVSDEDLEVIAPGRDPADYARELLATTAQLVIVTLGDAGALGFCADGDVKVAGPKVDVVDTVGAGDTLMGSVVAELMLRDLNTPSALAGVTSDRLGDILTYAVTAAAMNCEASGCAPPKRAAVLEALAAKP